jgi:hypothetical protein
MGLREDILAGKIMGVSANDMRWAFGLEGAPQQEREDAVFHSTRDYVDVTAIGDASRTYLTSTSNTVYSGNTACPTTITIHNTDPTNYTVRSDPFRLTASDPLSRELEPKAETPQAWLKRRVNEICWRPS